MFQYVQALKNTVQLDFLIVCLPSDYFILLHYKWSSYGSHLYVDSKY